MSKIIKSGMYKGFFWEIIQTNSGNLGSPIDYKMQVKGLFSSDYFRSLEPWSIKRELAQAKAYIDEVQS